MFQICYYNIIIQINDITWIFKAMTTKTLENARVNDPLAGNRLLKTHLEINPNLYFKQLFVNLFILFNND